MNTSYLEIILHAHGFKWGCKAVIPAFYPNPEHIPMTLLFPSLDSFTWLLKSTVIVKPQPLKQLDGRGVERSTDAPAARGGVNKSTETLPPLKAGNMTLVIEVGASALP